MAPIGVREPRPTVMGTATVLLNLAKRSITTQFFSIEARYVVRGPFGDDSKRSKVVVLAHHTEVGVAAMAAYGFEEGTQEIVIEKDRPNAITMMLISEADAPTVSVHILDATTQVELAAPFIVERSEHSGQHQACSVTG